MGKATAGRQFAAPTAGSPSAAHQLTLFIDLDVHPRVIIQILRHIDQAATPAFYQYFSSPLSVPAILLGAFPKWPAFLASQY